MNIEVAVFLFFFFKYGSHAKEQVPTRFNDRTSAFAVVSFLMPFNQSHHFAALTHTKRAITTKFYVFVHIFLHLNFSPSKWLAVHFRCFGAFLYFFSFSNRSRTTSTAKALKVQCKRSFRPYELAYYDFV